MTGRVAIPLIVTLTVFCVGLGAGVEPMANSPHSVGNPPSGKVTVAGKAVNESLTFPPSSSKATYTVTFTEDGLHAGTPWSVILEGVNHTSTSTNLTFTEPNGTYAYVTGNVSGYTSTVPSGTVMVNGSAASVFITFAAIAAGAYLVTFDETGLPTGSQWSVEITEPPYAVSTGSIITFTEPNGTYVYTVGGPRGYVADPSTGSLKVQGKAVTLSVTFTKSPSKATYTVTFSETGLPSGASWSVTLNGSTQSSASAADSFQMVNGSYPFSVGAVSGYTASPSSGTVQVSGNSSSEAVAFAISENSTSKKTTSCHTNQTTSCKTNNQTTTFLGLPGDDGYVLIGVVVAAVAAVLAVILIRKQKGPQPAPPPMWSPPPPAGPPPSP